MERMEISCPHCKRVYVVQADPSRLANARSSAVCGRCRKRFSLKMRAVPAEPVTTAPRVTGPTTPTSPRTSKRPRRLIQRDAVVRPNRPKRRRSLIGYTTDELTDEGAPSASPTARRSDGAGAEEPIYVANVPPPADLDERAPFESDEDATVLPATRPISAPPMDERPTLLTGPHDELGLEIDDGSIDDDLDEQDSRPTLVHGEPDIALALDSIQLGADALSQPQAPDRMTAAAWIDFADPGLDSLGEDEERLAITELLAL